MGKYKHEMVPALVLSMPFRVATDIHFIKYVCSFAFQANRRLLLVIFPEYQSKRKSGAQ